MSERLCLTLAHHVVWPCPVQAKEKKEREEVHAKKTEEIKERKENLEKKLQKLPQIYMNPAARSLVERTISSLRTSGLSTHRAHGQESGGQREEVEEITSAKKQADGALRRSLRKMGWRIEDVDRMLNHLQDDRSPTLENDDQDLKARLNRALDWLCFHVDEEHLPAEFQPAKTLEIGTTSFPSGKKEIPKGKWFASSFCYAVCQVLFDSADMMDTDEQHEAEVELLQQIDLIKPDENAPARLYTLFAIVANKAAKSSEANPLLSLDSPSVAGAAAALPKESKADANEIEELRREEALVLEAILGDDLCTEAVSLAELGGDSQPVSVHNVRLSAESLSLDASCFLSTQLALKDLRLMFHILALPHSLYPFQLPFILPAVSLRNGSADHEPCDLAKRVGARLEHRIMNELAAQAHTMLGAAMIYSLCQWLQTNLSQLIREVVQQELRPLPAPSAVSAPSPAPMKLASSGSNPDAGFKHSEVDRGSRKPKSVEARRPGSKAANPRDQEPDERTIERVGALLIEDVRAKQQNPQYAEMQRGRQRLPAASKRNEILHCIRSSQVVVLSGATGTRLRETDI